MTISTKLFDFGSPVSEEMDKTRQTLTDPNGSYQKRWLNVITQHLGNSLSIGQSRFFFLQIFLNQHAMQVSCLIVKFSFLVMCLCLTS